MILVRNAPASATSGGSYAAANKDAGTLRAGAPVATHPSGTGVVAASAADATKAAVGLLTADVAAGFAGSVQVGGILTLADWTRATGSATLAARATYYLDVTAGRLTTTPPSTAGQVIQRIGVAVSTTTLDLQVGRSILL